MTLLRCPNSGIERLLSQDLLEVVERMITRGGAEVVALVREEGRPVYHMRKRNVLFTLRKLLPHEIAARSGG